MVIELLIQVSIDVTSLCCLLLAMNAIRLLFCLLNLDYKLNDALLVLCVFLHRV